MGHPNADWMPWSSGGLREGPRGQMEEEISEGPGHSSNYLHLHLRRNTSWVLELHKADR